MFTGTTDKKSPSDPGCYVHCKSLTRDDYVDLTWTTLAEFPGMGSDLLRLLHIVCLSFILIYFRLIV